MPNIRVDRQVFPFFNSVKEPVAKNGISESFKNNGFSNLTLEVSGATNINLTIEGCVNILNAKDTALQDSECQWTPLVALDNKNFAICENIESNGIYSISIGGVSRVRIKITSISGAATIVGVAEV